MLVGGVDTRDVPIAELRASVALVTQRPVLFSVPLRENLLAGREDADWDEVLAACAAAGVDAFGPTLPDGYDTLIGERGVNLSGGQRQRVALARALVTGARVVVLDDPLSAVDTFTERRLVKRLRPALAGRTVLVATQRLSTVELADRAVVLVDGRIVESGTPAELLRAGGPVRDALRRRGDRRMRRLWKYLEGRRLIAALMILVGAGNAAGQTGGWLLVRNAIDNGIASRQRAPPDDHRRDLPRRRRGGLGAAGVMIRGLAAIGQAIVIGLRRDLFDHLTGLSLRYFSQQKAGWIIARLTSDVDAVSDTLSQGMPTLVSSIILLPAAVVALLIADWRLGLIAFAVLPPALILSRWFQRISHAANVEQRNRIAAVTAQIAESVAGMAVVQAFNRERRFQAEFDELNAANRAQATYVQKIFSVFFPSIEFLGVLATGRRPLLRLAPLRARRPDDRDADHGDLPPAARLPAAAGALGRVRPAAVGTAAMVKIASILDEEPEIRDRPGARRCRGSSAISISSTSSSRTGRSRFSTASRSACRRAIASRSSASRVTASRRSRG